MNINFGSKETPLFSVKQTMHEEWLLVFMFRRQI
jgi:hypothetical protein